MKKMKKRMLAAFMTATMLFSSFVMNGITQVYAEEEIIQQEKTESLDGTEVASETTSENSSENNACLGVKASLESGTYAYGTVVTLSSDTEGAVVYYNTTGSDTHFSVYDGAEITLTEDVTIKAYAECEGYEDSIVSAYTYTVDKSGMKLDTLETGDEVVIYNPANEVAVGKAVDSTGKGLTPVAATLTDDKLQTTAEMDTFSVKVVTDEETGEVSYYVFMDGDGKYLTSGETGSSLSLSEEETEYSQWMLEEADGGYYLKNVNAVYTNTKTSTTYPQYLEFFSSTSKYQFTVYSFSTSKTGLYLVNFYVPTEVVEETETETETEAETETEIETETETEIETETEASTETTAELPLMTALADGNEFVLYHPNSKLALSTSVASGSSKKLAGVESTLTEDGKLQQSEEAAVLTAVQDEDTGYFNFLVNGKYLTTGSTGGSLSLADTSSDYSLWEVIATETEGIFYIRSVNATYNSSQNQYVEYYSGFTTYSFKASSSALYEVQLYLVDEGTPIVKYDDTYTTNVAMFGGGANYDNISDNTIYGDLYTTNDMLDTNTTYTAVVSGQRVKPYTSSASNGGTATTYYMGGTGLGSGSDDYLQFALSSRGYANMSMSFRMRASNTGPGSFTIQYSTDGGETFTNFTTGTYSYSYTKYTYTEDGDSTGTPVSESGEITDGVARTSLCPATYITFTFDVPAAASNAESLLIRMVPGTDAAKSGKTLNSGGTIRVADFVITGSPVVSKSIVGYVSADVAAGETAVGTEVTLTSSTEGATIYYSLDGGENFTQYDDTAKVVLTELPCTLICYAEKEGCARSITTTYAYKKSTVATVKATPNGGAVTEGTKVSLKCSTEGASIYYAFVDSADTEVADEDWVLYESSFALEELPQIIKVKATKEGYTDSAVSNLSFTLRENETYNIYFGQVHSHTNYSDGAGSVEEAFQYATQVDNLDFLAVTDHSNSLDNASNSDLNTNVDTSDSDEWTSGHALADQYSTEDFTCIYGFEMTWSNGLGHMNTFNTAGFQSRTQTEYATYSTALQNYYDKLLTAPDSISMFNHPGTTFGDFQDFSYFAEDIDNQITMIEVGNGEGTIGSSGYFPSYEYYTRALDKGWHVAPTNNQDNHKGKWGDANTARTVVLADSNTEENIYDAMRNYRIYATEDNDLSIYYTLDDYIMGTILEEDQVGDNVNIQVVLSDATDEVGTVEVIVNGGLSVASTTVSGLEGTVNFEIPSNYSYYYIRVTETDGDIAVTAPVWVGSVEACGINDTYTNTTLPVQGESLDINVDLFNNESTDLVIDAITFYLDDEIIKEVSPEELAAAELLSVASTSTGTYSFDYVYDGVGSVTYSVKVQATLDGVQKEYNDKFTVSYVPPTMVSNVIVDGTHYNDYVTGYYGGNMGSFVSLAGDKNIRVTIETEEITAEDLADCKLLILAAPAKKEGTANAGAYSVSHYEDEFLAMVAEYVQNGGSVIVCGLADYSDTVEGQTATEQNKLLEAIGSTLRMNSDEVYDEENNGGQAYRMYLTNFNTDSKYLDGVVEGQTYSQYSGCSVNVDGAEATDFVSAGESLVMGFDTTYSIDCKTDSGSTSDKSVYVEKGNVTVLAHQSTAAGGEIFVSGGIFMSDFEIDAEIDNNDSLPYANQNIINNILTDAEVQLETTSIADARNGEMGDIFAVEGYVTSGTVNENTTFFDTIYIQDETGGMDIFPYAEIGLEIGTKMRVVGTLDAYQGDIELRVISYSILDEDPYVYEATVLNTQDAMDYDTYGGMLVQTTGTVTRIELGSDGSTLSEFWIVDETGEEAAIFIDGYINSGTTGENTLAEFVQVGAQVQATGILYMHPEGDSEESVPVFRVRDCDDVVLVQAASESGSGSSGSSSDSSTGSSSSSKASSVIAAVTNVVSGIISAVTNTVSNIVSAVANTVTNAATTWANRIWGRNSRTTQAEATQNAGNDVIPDEGVALADGSDTVEETAEAEETTDIEEEDTALAADATSVASTVLPVTLAVVVVLAAGGAGVFFYRKRKLK